MDTRSEVASKLGMVVANGQRKYLGLPYLIGCSFVYLKDRAKKKASQLKERSCYWWLERRY